MAKLFQEAVRLHKAIAPSHYALHYLQYTECTSSYPPPHIGTIMQSHLTHTPGRQKTQSPTPQSPSAVVSQVPVQCSAEVVSASLYPKARRPFLSAFPKTSCHLYLARRRRKPGPSNPRPTESSRSDPFWPGLRPTIWRRPKSECMLYNIQAAANVGYHPFPSQ
jgi:hypothetical protein